jgi:hypothetical protein
MQVFREQGVPFAGQEKTSSLRYPDQATFHPLKSPIDDRYAIHSKQAPYRTYAMAFSVPRSALRDGF